MPNRNGFVPDPRPDIPYPTKNSAPAVRFSNPPEALAARDNLEPVAWPDWGFSFTELALTASTNSFTYLLRNMTIWMTRFSGHPTRAGQECLAQRQAVQAQAI